MIAIKNQSGSIAIRFSYTNRSPVFIFKLICDFQIAIATTIAIKTRSGFTKSLFCVGAKQGMVIVIRGIPIAFRPERRPLSGLSKKNTGLPIPASR